MSKNIILIFLLLLVTNCSLLKPSNKLNNRQKLKILKQELGLTQLEYQTLKKDDIIINEAYKTLIDTVEVSKINNRLDSFFAKKYSSGKTHVALIMERVHKGREIGFQFTGEETKDSLGTFTPEMERQLRQYFLEIDKALERAGGQWVTDSIMINSRDRNEPDSVRKKRIKQFFKRQKALMREKLKTENPKKYNDDILKFNKTRDSLKNLKKKGSLN